MAPQRVLDSVREKLKAGQPALLVGLSGPAPLVVDVVNISAEQVSASVIAALLGLLPYGLGYVGTWASSAADAKQLLQRADLQQLLVPGGERVTAHQADGYPVFVSAHGLALAAEWVPAAPGAWLTDSHRLIRCFTTLQLDVYTAPQASTSGSVGPQPPTATLHAISSAFSRLEAQLSSDACVFVAQQLWVHRVCCERQGRSDPKQQHLVGPSSPGSLIDLKPGAPSTALEVPLLSARPMLDSGPSSSSQPACGPVFEFRPAGGGGGGSSDGNGGGCFEQASMTLRVDVLCCAPAATPLGSLGKEVLRPAMLRQLAAMQQVLVAELARKPAQVVAYHFLPPGRNHHVTALYACSSAVEGAAELEHDELRLAPIRCELHAALGLPTNRPVLRASMALSLCPPEAEAGAEAGGRPARLRDVHVGLPAPGIGGSATLIEGHYEYCHYMQDRFNDNGWGCAYRSLQTIVSWFRQQRYTSKPIPSHREIQEILVRLGDKEKGFVGSSQWIGAIELSYILDDYLGVTCKVMTVNRGSEIPNHARALAAHFKQHGTPVMIGGGVLAYTLLGVQFNEQTGEAAFLILDPHYTGGEDLKRIQQGTWVWWKRQGDQAAAGGPLFMPDAFYNFLCPQRPSSV